MSAPITHIVLADKIFDKYFAGKDRTLFMVGTSFPDIRRLGKIPREKVHYHNFSLTELKEHDAFITGLKFHSVVDLVSTKFTEDSHLHDLFPKTIYTRDAVKLFADRILQKKFTGWEKLAGYFNQIYSEELEYGVDKTIIEIWHQMLAKYFASDIHEEKTITELFIGNGTSLSYVNGIMKVVGQVKDYNQAEKLVLNFYANFEKYIDVDSFTL
jgi:hypothetical protein